MVFDLGAVPREHWHEKAGSLLGPGLEASLEDGEADLLTLQLRQPCPQSQPCRHRMPCGLRFLARRFLISSAFVVAGL